MYCALLNSGLYSLRLDLHLLELVLQLGGEADARVLGGQLLHRRVRHHRSRVLPRHVVRDERVVGTAIGNEGGTRLKERCTLRAKLRGSVQK